jgi:hypothetical protein
METVAIKVEWARAQEMQRQYREHRRAGVGTKTDLEIERCYREIARGRKMIRAIESVRQAGLDSNARPKLAIIRADAEWCYFSPAHNSCTFQMDRWTSARSNRRRIEIQWQGMQWTAGASGRARVPLIPVQHRPKVDLASYHLLFEADWIRYPIDPILLRRMGEDAWVVLAAWDLTEVERAVLSS